MNWRRSMSALALITALVGCRFEIDGTADTEDENDDAAELGGDWEEIFDAWDEDGASDARVREPPPRRLPDEEPTTRWRDAAA